MKKNLLFALILSIFVLPAIAKGKSLHELQQDFVNLRFGMFIHFNIPTFAPDDWPDPDLSPQVFYPKKLDCNQWADAALSANMKYGCLTTKHHSGFCIWNTKTTDYNVMNSPLRRDVVREFADAFRKKNLKVMLYFSILDTHHRIRPHMVTRKKVEMIKQQLRELLTNYGPISAVVIDGWDAPWSRLDYDEISFQEIYQLVKSLQPECLLMDLNAAKYPKEALFYTDIKSYEQGAGQHISTSENQLPALACLPLQATWFWKASMPTDQLKDPEFLVNKNIVPYGKAFCNFILNVAPNRDGLMDGNAIEALKQIGKLWKDDGKVAKLPLSEPPITGMNIAKFQPAESTWSWDYNLMDFANDDDFNTAWISNKYIKTPHWQVNIDSKYAINTISITEVKANVLQTYRIEYQLNGKWHPLFEGKAPTESRVKIHHFPAIHADCVRITALEHHGSLQFAEIGVYTSDIR